MKVYIVVGSYGRIRMVTTDKEKAVEKAKYYEWCAGCSGSHDMYHVEEHEVEE